MRERQRRPLQVHRRSGWQYLQCQPGKISFYLKSQYSLAQRMASAGAARSAFDVRDGNGSHLLSFLRKLPIGTSNSAMRPAARPLNYAVPVGMEDALFGNGVILQVTLSWGVSGANRYLNNILVKSVPYTAPSPNRTAASKFDLGAFECLTFERL
jgi:hypothetical protein